MGTGSYCWSDAGRSGVCADMIGIVTGTKALVAAAGATIAVANPVPGSAAQIARATAYSATGQVLPIQGGEQAWIGAAANGTPLAVTVTSAGIEFGAALAPGQYVVDVAMQYPQGSVRYGLLLEVR